MENSRMSLAERELEIPVSEPERQYYFIDRARKDLEKMKEAAGRQLTFCVTTFGCQMNARDSEKLAGILEQIGYIEGVRKAWTARAYQEEKPAHDDRPLRLYDAGAGSGGKAEEELSVY